MYPQAACTLHSCHLFYTICEMKLSVDSAGARKPLAQIVCVCVFVCFSLYTQITQCMSVKLFNLNLQDLMCNLSAVFLVLAL